MQKLCLLLYMLKVSGLALFQVETLNIVVPEVQMYFQGLAAVLRS